MKMPGFWGVAKISKIVDYIQVKAKDLVRKLTALGATFEWGKGSHLNVFLNSKP
jgi:predicted RNA binding protein YcfA (HicA-like mRNA interferase family)